MSVSGTPESLTITPTERTWRATVETPYGQPYSLTIHREVQRFDASNNQVGDPVTLPPIVLDYASIAAETVTIGDVTLTVEQISGFMRAYFDQKAQQLAAPP